MYITALTVLFYGIDHVSPAAIAHRTFSTSFTKYEGQETRKGYNYTV